MFMGGIDHQKWVVYDIAIPTLPGANQKPSRLDIPQTPRRPALRAGYSAEELGSGRATVCAIRCEAEGALTSALTSSCLEFMVSLDGL